MALPVSGSTRLIPAYCSFYRPRKDERLSWPSWLTYSGWFTHISGHPSAAGREQDRESSPARDRRSTTVPRHLHVLVIKRSWCRRHVNYVKGGRCHSTDNTSLAVFLFLPTLCRWRGTVVERRSLADELSLFCARPAADG